MKSPKQVLRAATLWEEGFPLDQLPHYFYDVYGSSEKLPEVPRLRRRRADRARRPVLYVPGQCLKFGCDMAQGMILLFVIGRLDGGHRLCRRRRRQRQRRRGRRGEGGRELEVGVCVLCMCDVAFFLGAYTPVLYVPTLR
jgi:hypothetical protein